MEIRCLGKSSSSKRTISMWMYLNTRISGYVFTLFVAALLLTNGAAAQAQCSTADALLKAHLYDDALANYTDLLKQNPKLDCALNGINESLRAQALNFYELGRAYENAGQVKEANDAYANALQKYPTFGDAQEALARLNGGVLTKAYKLYTWLLPALEIIVVIAIFAFIIFILYYKITPWIMGLFGRPRLDIQDFNNGATGLEIGKGMMAMVEESLMQLGENVQARVHLVSGPVEKLTIPVDIKEISTPIKTVANLIEWLFPPNVITLSGYLEKPGNRGVGLTLSMVSRSGDIIGNTTIWQKDYDSMTTQSVVKENDPTSYYALAEPTAIWAFFQLNPQIRKGTICRIKIKFMRFFNRVIHSKGNTKEKFTLMGTDDWQSYAYFRAGVHCELDGKKDKARQLYLDAQNQDTNNYGALVNLGYLDTEDENLELAIERLLKAKEMTEYLFSWDEVPGNDSGRLIEFLKQEFGICWVETAKIKKIDGDRTIKVPTLSLRLDDEKTKVNLKTDDGRSVELTAKSENGKLNIYMPEKSKKFHRDTVWYVATYQLAAVYHYQSILLRECLFCWDKIGRIPENDNERLIKYLKQNFHIDWLKPRNVEKTDDRTISVKSEKNCLFLRLEGTKVKLLPVDMSLEISELSVKKENSVLNVYRAKEDISKADNCLNEAEKESLQLIETIQENLQNESLKKNEPALRKHLESIESNANIMHASILVDLAYKEIPQDKGRIDKARSNVQNIESIYSKLTSRVRYNLVCYYSILGHRTKDSKAYEAALNHLKYALERGGDIVQWAQIDLSLKGVRESKETKSEFDEIIKKYVASETHDSAAGAGYKED